MRTSRRHFLSLLAGSSAVVSLHGAIPRFIQRAAAAQDGVKGDQGTILVIVQLTGRNDGLNTIVPYEDEIYQRSRPTLAIGRQQVLKIDDYLGFHPSMRPFAELLDAGQLAIVQGVGYAQPNRSHFESMDIWHTCQRKDERRESGWLGRYLDEVRTGSENDVPALHLGGDKQPLALAARDVRVPSIRSLDRFRLQGGDAALRRAMKELASTPRDAGDDLLGFVQSSTSSAIEMSARMEQASRSYRPAVGYPENELGEHLQTIAQLIHADLGARIYYTELAGFDTHSLQVAAHAALLNQFTGAVGAFVQDLTAQGHAERVLLMSFSEFGRRVEENASKGTDHGAAAPMFLAGGRVRSGLIGSHPSLTELDDGDLKHHTDFRQLYATVLEQWLGWPSAPILGKQYETLPVIA